MPKPAIVGEHALSTTAIGEFDPGLLGRFARRELADRRGEFLIERIAGGRSNPTYFVTLGARPRAFGEKPAGETLPSAHAVEREHRVLSALAATDVAAPASAGSRTMLGRQV